MVRAGVPAGRWVAGAECPGGLRRVASTHIPRLARARLPRRSLATARAASLAGQAGAPARSPPLRQRPRGDGGEDASPGRGGSPGGTSGWGRCGSEASCSSRALRRSLLRSGWGIGMGVDSQSVGGDDEDRRLVDLSEHVRPEPAHPPGRIANSPRSGGRMAPPRTCGRCHRDARQAGRRVRIEGGLNLLGGEAVGGNLLQVPLDPLEPPHRLNIPCGHRARQSRRVRRAFDDAPIVWRSPDACDGSRNGASSRT